MSTGVGTTTTTTNTNSRSTVIGGDYVKGESSTWLGGAGGGGVESGTPPGSNNGGGGGGLRHGQKKRRFGRNKRLSMSSMRLPFSSDSHPSQLVPARVSTSCFFLPLNRIHSYVINYYSLLSSTISILLLLSFVFFFSIYLNNCEDRSISIV